MKNISNPAHFLHKMPKVELHIHLEGAIPLGTLHEIIKKYEKKPFSVDELTQKFTFSDFPHFLQMWKWKNTFMREYDDFEYLAEHVAADLHQQNIVYAEMNISAPTINDFNLKPDRLIESIRRGLNKIPNIEINLIMDMVRNTDPKIGLYNLDMFAELRELGIIGIDIGGPEQTHPAELWTEVYKKAELLEFKRTAHAGEASGPESIWSAIHNLHVQRIGHGTTAIKDTELIQFLKEEQLPLELNPGSNVKTKVVDSLQEHPVRTYFDEDLLVCINTDDPKMFQTNLVQEYLDLMDVHNFSWQEIYKLGENAIKSSWVDSEKKTLLSEQLQKYFN